MKKFGVVREHLSGISSTSYWQNKREGRWTRHPTKAMLACLISDAVLSTHKCDQA